MICPNCGTNIDDNATECFLCGCHIEKQNISANEQNYSINTCPVCGAEISEQECVCPICGSPIEKTTHIENTQKEYDAEDIEKSQPQNSSNKKLVIIISVIAVVIIGVLLFLLLSKKDTKDGQKEMSQAEVTTVSVTEPTTETSTETTTTSTTTEATTTVTEVATTTETYADVSSYIGFWHPENNAESELTIHSIDSSTVTFSLWYYRLCSIENLTAIVEQNSAYFYNDEIEGILTFDDDSIRLYITMSNISGIPSQYEEVYSMRIDESVQYGNGMKYFENVSAFEPYIIQITNPKLSIYDSPNYDANIVGEITDKGSYTIVDEYCNPSDSPAYYTWGKLKSGVGWINIYDATMLND